jgi:3D (Asp-Asp-Asp) domain-containing protein
MLFAFLGDTFGFVIRAGADVNVEEAGQFCKKDLLVLYSNNIIDTYMLQLALRFPLESVTTS